jgi:hypothetical protein
VKRRAEDIFSLSDGQTVFDAQSLGKAMDGPIGAILLNVLTVTVRIP